MQCDIYMFDYAKSREDLQRELGIRISNFRTIKYQIMGSSINAFFAGQLVSLYDLDKTSLSMTNIMSILDVELVSNSLTCKDCSRPH